MAKGTVLVFYCAWMAWPPEHQPNNNTAFFWGWLCIVKSSLVVYYIHFNHMDFCLIISNCVFFFIFFVLGGLCCVIKLTNGVTFKQEKKTNPFLTDFNFFVALFLHSSPGFAYGHIFWAFIFGVKHFKIFEFNGLIEKP